MFNLLRFSGLSAVFFFVVARAALAEAAETASPADSDDFAKQKVLVELAPVRDPNSGIAGAQLFESDWFPPLNDPDWAPYTQEDDPIKPQGPVLGLDFSGKSWAIPWTVIGRYHVANFTLDGKAVLIAVCRMCSSAIARDPIVDGRRLTFHVVGLYNGSILLADYETKTYWTPFTGEALEGPLKGKKLKQLPLLQCQSNQWMKLHPRGVYVYGPTRAPSALRTRIGFLNTLLKPLDQRVQAHALVLGVTVGDKARAYPVAALDGPADSDAKNIALNDTIGKESVVVLHERGGALTIGFSRRLGGKTLQFALDKDGRFMDSTFHSHWNYQGEALDGPVAGQKLPEIASQLEDWYIWAAFHPDTSIYQAQPTAQLTKAQP